MNPYQKLADAIVMQAVKDWRYAVKRLRKNPTAWSLKKMKKETERFLLSDWFCQLTSTDGGYILERLREEAA